MSCTLDTDSLLAGLGGVQWAAQRRHPFTPVVQCSAYCFASRWGCGPATWRAPRISVGDGRRITITPRAIVACKSPRSSLAGSAHGPDQAPHHGFVGERGFIRQGVTHVRLVAHPYRPDFPMKQSRMIRTASRSGSTVIAALTAARCKAIYKARAAGVECTDETGE